MEFFTPKQIFEFTTSKCVGRHVLGYFLGTVDGPQEAMCLGGQPAGSRHRLRCISITSWKPLVSNSLPQSRYSNSPHRNVQGDMFWGNFWVLWMVHRRQCVLVANQQALGTGCGALVSLVGSLWYRILYPRADIRIHHIEMCGETCFGVFFGYCGWSTGGNVSWWPTSRL